jgi:hypothetical protein
MNECADAKSLETLFRINYQFHESALLNFSVAYKIFDEFVFTNCACNVAQQKGWIRVKCEIVLNALTAMGLLKKTENSYINSELASKYLVSTSEGFLGPIMDHQRLQWKLWSEIEMVLTAESSVQQQQELRFSQDATANKAFNEAMIRLSRDYVDEVASLDVFKRSKYVADICGGHGSYLVEIARRYSHINGEIWDLPVARLTAEQLFKKGGVQERVMFREVDLRSVNWLKVDNFNVVMLNDCLHYFSENEVCSIIAGCARVLLSKGVLIILSMTLSDDGCAPIEAAGFSMHMMLNTLFGRLHPTNILVNAVVATGLDVHVSTVGPLGRYSMIVGSKH